MEEEMGSEVDRFAYIGATNIISSLGFTTGENFKNALSYLSGISMVDDLSISETPILAARVDKNRLCNEVQKHGLKDFTPLEQMLILSIKSVIESSKIEITSGECAIIFSTTKGNIDALELNTCELNSSVFLGVMAKRVSSYFNNTNEPIIISNACISGVSATILASRLIREGKYKNVIVTGADLLSAFVVSGFTAFKSVSLNPCIPYDALRDGLTLGEGCASMLITSERDFSTGVVIEGGAITNDANHISGPSRTGDGLCYAMEQAMSETALVPNDINFINAHGTATSFNDEMESKAIKLAGLNTKPVNSLKPYFGHTLGAAGLIELVMCVEELKSNTILATKGFKTLGVPEPIIVSGQHIFSPLKRCIKTASGFGGCNGALILATENEAKAIKKSEIANSKLIATCTIEQGQVELNGVITYQSEPKFGEFIRGAFKSLDAPNMKFFKMDDLCKLGYLAAENLMKDHSYQPTEIGIVLANRSSSLDTDIKHQNILNEHLELGASPAIFVYTLPNVVLGEICIRHKIQGENTFFIAQEKPTEFLKAYANQLLLRKGYKAIIYGWCELLGDDYNAHLTLLEKQ